VKQSKAITIIYLFLAGLLAGCVYVDYTVPVAGKYDRAGTAVKNFILLDTVTVYAAEKHTVSPLGIKRKVEGAKVTYSDLMQEAAGLDADDIINVRIDMKTTGKTTFADWLKGWERTFFYTGQALAIKYVDNEETEEQ
jgi:transposase-like protein